MSCKPLPLSLIIRERLRDPLDILEKKKFPYKEDNLNIQTKEDYHKMIKKFLIFFERERFCRDIEGCIKKGKKTEEKKK